jgi:hypothetical protein
VKRKSVPAPPPIHFSSDLNRDDGGKDDDGDEKVLQNGDPFKVSQQPIHREERQSAQGYYQTHSHIHQFIVGRKWVKTGIIDNRRPWLAKIFRPITRGCRSMLPAGIRKGGRPGTKTGLLPEKWSLSAGGVGHSLTKPAKKSENGMTY